MRKILLTLLISLFIAETNAQNYWSFTAMPNHWSAIAGTQVFQTDDDGVIYLGESSLFEMIKFNGSGYDSIPIGGIPFNQFVLDQNKTLWTSSGGSITHYNSSFNPTTWPMSLPYMLSDMAVDINNDIVFFGKCLADSTCRIYKFDHITNQIALVSSISKANSNVKFNELPGELKVAPNGDLWFQADNSTLLKYDGSSILAYHADSLFQGQFIFKNMEFKQNNDLYVLTTKLGVSYTDTIRKFDGNTWTSFPLSLSSYSWVYEFALDENEDFWLVLDNMFLKYDGVNLTPYVLPFGVNGYSISHLNINSNIVKSYYTSIAQQKGLGCYNPYGINTISGKVYHDQNSDGQYQSTERIYEPSIVDCDGNTVFNSMVGYNYYLTTITTSSIQITPPKYWTVNGSNPISVTQTLQGEITDSIDFGLIPNQSANDVEVYGLTSIVRPNLPSMLWLVVNNIGTQAESDSISIMLDSSLSFIAGANPNLTINGQRAVWNYGTLQPFEKKYLSISILPDSTLGIGDSVQNLITAYPFATDADTSNNRYLTNDYVITSFDPNEKNVVPEGVGANHSILNQELTYTIRFQNTGTDTAFTVIIFDTISNNLDLSTFKFIGASHNCNVQLLDRVLSFRFNNILLPDSFVNEPLSHGFATFKISPNVNTAPGTLIENTAGIVFDYNTPVITNTAFNTIQLFIALEETENPGSVLIVSPNPFHQQEVIKLNRNFEASTTYSIVDLTGKIIRSGMVSANSIPSSSLTMKSGMYLLRITEAGGRTYSSKILIE